MTFRLALRSLATQPVRSLVLAGGFGVGIAAMAGLLGVGEVILEQSRSPALEGGGDVVLTGHGGRLHNARYLISNVLRREPFAGRVRALSPSVSTTLYLVDSDGTRFAVPARGGIPSLERSIDDRETAAIAGWQDAAADRAWAEPEASDVLRAMDRFHPIPEVPARADSWAEWLYFNGKSTDGTRFYLTFLVGRRVGQDRRAALVRLQLEHGGGLRVYSARHEIAEAELLAGAPDIRIGRSHVRLDGTSYRIHLELERERDVDDSGRADAAAELLGDLALDASAAGALPPLTVRGAGGWVSGYVVPVLSGPLTGKLTFDGAAVRFTDAVGYHDHNWGFWEGVTWQWGQVAGDEISLVFGRIRPPADAADPERLPGFLLATGADGLLGHAMRVRIAEIDAPPGDHPSAFEVEAFGDDLSIRMRLEVEEATRTPYRNSEGDSEMTFMQLRARYRVDGHVAGRQLAFSALGSAETFRGE